MARSPVFDDAQTSGSDLVLQAVVYRYHAVCDILHQAVARQSFLSAFARDYGCDPFILQPPEKPGELRSQDDIILES